MPTSLTVAALAAGAIAAGSAGSILAAAAAPAATTPTATTPTATTPTTTTPATTTPLAPPPVDVQVSRTRVGRPIAPGFLGFSFEYKAVREYTGSSPRAINPVLVQLIRDLNPKQSPVLRIGGNSADQTWIPARGVKVNPSINFTITPSWLATTRALAEQTGGRMIFDLNLKLNSTPEMVAEAHAFETGIGASNIKALEIGNEPELYPITPFYYRKPNHTPVYPRPKSFNRAAYVKEMAGFAKQLGPVPLAGPATGNYRWLTRLPKLFKVEPKLKVVSYHRYPLIRCFSKPGDAGYPSIPNLLSPNAARGLLSGTGPYIALAHRHGATFRVDELNSVACKGQPGVSDTFASALWMLDTLFAMARTGVDGVNIHTLPEAIYHPFTFQQMDGRWQASVFPEYYGMLLFTEAAPPGSRLLAVSTPANPDIRVRAALTPDGLIHVVLLNDSLTTDQTIALQSPAGTGKSAIVERLNAPGGASATSGVTLAGQSFGEETTTGTLTGKFQADHLTPTDGQYLINLPASSAAMVSFAPAATGSRPGPRTGATH
ncbi:MAG TPA: glycosyl hydrolase family 79 C-terminal domain-containing protein [Solirubrobacteraceae bacterium]|nr:glycosyl hydrolase family 79 C-terminal domain-containing protein [Solirubrobacteraceae bacterium]